MNFFPAASLLSCSRSREMICVFILFKKEKTHSFLYERVNFFENFKNLRPPARTTAKKAKKREKRCHFFELKKEKTALFGAVFYVHYQEPARFLESAATKSENEGDCFHRVYFSEKDDSCQCFWIIQA